MNPPGITHGLTPSQHTTPEQVMVEVWHERRFVRRQAWTEGRLVIGSGAAADLRVEDPTVSRQHAVAELVPGKVKVRDLNSRNGTEYLGASIGEALVPLGGMIKLGRTEVVFIPDVSGGLTPYPHEELAGLSSRSPAMRVMFSALERLATVDTSVLLIGETGVGKERVARTLHAISNRQARPFEVFDCASADAALMEDALFGHLRGAFTDAKDDRPGIVELAEGGVLYLDHVGELPLSLQPKLLRFLEERTFTKLGEGKRRLSNVRFVASHHRELSTEVDVGRFRSDLYYRLAGAELRIPPLRERPEDVSLLAERFASEIAPGTKLEEATVTSLMGRPWSGNLRELRNFIERLLTVGEAQPTEKPRGYGEARESLMGSFQKEYLQSLLEKHHGNVSAAARDAKMARSHFYRLLEKHQIRTRPGTDP